MEIAGKAEEEDEEMMTRNRARVSEFSRECRVRETAWLATHTFQSVTIAHVILRWRVESEIIGFLSVTDTYVHTYIQTISEMRRRISCLALRRLEN